VGGSGVLLLPDGRVEVVLEGDDGAVAGVLDALDGAGAPGRVTGVDSRDEPARGGSAFTTE
jgi:acylphosphatase